MKSSHGNPLQLGQIAGSNQNLRIQGDQRDKHLYVCGATGTGKSKFLEHLIRQDIRNWSKTKCGLLLIDPHGSLYDGLVGWLARERIRRPVVLVDLRSSDWILAYNLLRERKIADAGVVVDNLLQAMAYVWGASGTDETPLFARWGKNLLSALYSQGYTLTDSLYLMERVDANLRKAMVAGLPDGPVRRDWDFANMLRPQEFEAQMGSTVNRMRRFMSNRTIQSTFGQLDVSIDLRKAIDEGYIILVNTATERQQISEEAGDLFATLLMTDLWNAAAERGKNKGKPFYVFLDEFQRFLIPTIGQNLAQARGFGLHLTLANQFPRQLLSSGPQGQRIYDEVMENASSKVCFRMTVEENLLPMAKWLFMTVMDPDMIKHALYSTKVMQYREEQRHSYSHTKSQGHSDGYGDAVVEGGSVGRSRSVQGDDDENASETDSSSDQSSWSRSENHSSSSSESHGVTETPTLIPVIGKELSSVQFRSIDEQLYRAMAVLFDQEQRQGVARLVGMRAPVSFFTPLFSSPYATPKLLELYTVAQHKQWNFMLPAAEAQKRIEDRARYIKGQLQKDVAAAAEPATYAIKPARAKK